MVLGIRVIKVFIVCRDWWGFLGVEGREFSVKFGYLEVFRSCFVLGKRLLI